MAAGRPRPLTGFPEESLPFFGRGAGGVGEVERKALCSLLQVVPVLSLPDPGCGSLCLPSGDPLTPGAGSERREEDSFDSESTATLLK